MLDTNCFDRAASIRDLLKGVVILTTPVQEAEIAAIPDPVRRKAVQAVERLVIPLPEPGPELMPSPKHRGDALIGAAAAGGADILVTEDAAFARRMAAAGGPCRVLAFDAFLQFLADEAGATG